MDITKARKVVELSRDNKKILVTLWEGDRISSCVTEETKQRCETCQGGEELCGEYITHLREQGYQATEIEVGDLGIEESLPKFLKEREHPVVETEVIEHADIGTTEAVPGSPGELQPGESEGGSPETS